MKWTLVLIEPDNTYQVTETYHVGTCIETMGGTRYDYFKCDPKTHTLWARRVMITRTLRINRLCVDPDVLTLYEKNLIMRVKGCLRPHFRVRVWRDYVLIRASWKDRPNLPSLQTMLIESL